MTTEDALHQLADLAERWTRGIRDVVEFGQVFAESTVRIRAQARNGRRHGLLIDPSFGIGIMVRVGGKWRYRGAPVGESDALASWVTALGGSVPSGIRGLAPILPVEVDTSWLVDAHQWMTGISPGDDVAVLGTEDDVRAVRVVVDTAGTASAWRSGGTRRRCDVEVTGRLALSRGTSRAFASHESPEQMQAPDELTRSALSQAYRLANSGSTGPRTTPVVLAPAAGAALLHELIGHALEADNLRRASPYTRDLADCLLTTTSLTIVDDPTRANGYGSAAYDDEGLLSAPKTLVEGGRVVGDLTCMRSVYGTGGDSSGHGRRASYRHPPIPRATNTVVESGPDSPENLLTAGPDGLLHVKALGAGEIDLHQGEFSFAAIESEYLTAAGERVPLRDVNLFGSAREALRRLVGIADDVAGDNVTCGKQNQLVGIGLYSPTMRFDDMDWRS